MTRHLLLSLLFGSIAYGAAVNPPQHFRHGRRANAQAVWKPAVGAQFQMILSGTVDPAGLSSLAPSTPEIWDVDLESTPKETIAALHGLGKKVICYFSAGSSEDWRTDYASFLPTDKGECLQGWRGERWLDVRSDNVFQIMKGRIASAAEKKCDGVDPDNMDGWAVSNGFSLTSEDSKAYLRKLSTEAHSYGMAIGLKNAQGILNDVRADIDFAVNEECSQYGGDCAPYTALIADGKPVLHVEYSSHSIQDGQAVLSGDKSVYCLESNPGYSSTFSTVIKSKNLDGWVMYCDGSWAETKVLGEPIKGGVDCASGL